MILFTIVLVCRVRIIVVIVLVCSTLCEYALLWWDDIIGLKDYRSQEYRFYCLFSHGFCLMQCELMECGKGPAWYGITSSNVRFVKIHAPNVQTYRKSETRIRWMHVAIKQNP